jgi:hypothetical protein
MVPTDMVANFFNKCVGAGEHQCTNRVIQNSSITPDPAHAAAKQGTSCRTCWLLFLSEQALAPFLLSFLAELRTRQITETK